MKKNSSEYNDYYKYTMDLNTNGVVVTDAIKIVEQSTNKLSMSMEASI
jgi:hypothetical protein